MQRIVEHRDVVMALSIRAPKDFWAGVIYFATGLAGFLIGQEYSFGSGARMGPGYFPSIISCLLIFFGVIAIFRSFMSDGSCYQRLCMVGGHARNRVGSSPSRS